MLGAKCELRGVSYAVGWCAVYVVCGVRRAACGVRRAAYRGNEPVKLVTPGH